MAEKRAAYIGPNQVKCALILRVQGDAILTKTSSASISSFQASILASSWSFIAVAHRVHASKEADSPVVVVTVVAGD